ncbi:hypothetical protein OGAPHI_005238 [Ogataea philodendri]|uniref:SWI5-dependent HO expression protein 3 n=1 Tax=Ogataea philodendri TaxID=1378263 RepID=A0A9P8P2B2_9ASCO|nr:uncharacterized protein OGAPHI_005238 [Ogataea philodendri]KAH3663835.1 hypothetical protein OGAPHI_005238 [Ogataea philodendri]
MTRTFPGKLDGPVSHHGGTSRVIESLQGEIDRLGDEVDDKDTEIADLKRKLAVVSRQNQVFGEQLSNARHEREVAEALLSRKERKLLDLEAQLTEACSAADAWMCEQESLRRKLASVQEEGKRGTEETERLKIAYDTVVASHKQYKLHASEEIEQLRRQLVSFAQETRAKLQHDLQAISDTDQEITANCRLMDDVSKQKDRTYLQKQAIVEEELTELTEAVKVQGHKITSMVTECEDTLLNLQRARANVLNRKETPPSEQSLNFSLVVNLDVHETTFGGQTRNGLDLVGQSVQIASTDGCLDVSDWENESGWDTLKLGVMRKRVLGLGNTDWQVGEALGSVLFDLFLGLRQELDRAGTVHHLRDTLDLLLDGRTLGRVEVLGTLSTLLPVVGNNGVSRTGSESSFLDNLVLLGRVGRHSVDGHNNVHAVLLGVLDVFLQVGASGSEHLHVLGGILQWQWSTGLDLSSTTVHLQSSDSGHDDDHVGRQSRRSALNVEESLSTHGEVETSFGDDVSGLLLLFLSAQTWLSTCELQSHLIGQHRRGTDRNVGKWTSVHKHRSSLQSLHDVRLDGILHDGSQGTGASKVLTGDWLTGLRGSNNHLSESLSHVLQRRRKSQNSHHLRSNGDIESSLSGKTFFGRSLVDGDSSERSVVEVQNSLPGDGLWINVESDELGHLFLGPLLRIDGVETKFLDSWKQSNRNVSRAVFLLWTKSLPQSLIALGGLVEHSCVESSSQQIVGHSNGVDVTGDVHVELVHRDDLGKSSSSSTTLNTESWAHRRLSNVGKGLLSQSSTNGLSKTHSGGGLTLTKWGWSDTGDQDVLTVFTVLQSVDHIELDLTLVSSIWFDFGFGDSVLGSNLANVLRSLISRDLVVRRDWLDKIQLKTFEV